MQRFSFFLLCMICANAANAATSAYLPVVDTSRGGISARAAFGEEIVQPTRVKSENLVRNAEPEKKVVARSAKKTVANNNVTVGGDILRPNRPRSDLWAKSGNEQPLRMPRMDEIAVIGSYSMEVGISYFLLYVAAEKTTR